MDTGLIDLSQVVAMLGSLGLTTWAISEMRLFFLDALLARLAPAQRDTVYKAANYVINFSLILAASLLWAHQPFGLHLLESVAVAAWLAATGSHYVFTRSVKTKSGASSAEPSYPEIPPSESGEEPEPPDGDTPVSAALAVAA